MKRSNERIIVIEGDSQKAGTGVQSTFISQWCGLEQSQIYQRLK